MALRFGVVISSVLAYAQCVDKNTNCAEWFAKGYCEDYIDFMTENCKKTCNFFPCTPPPTLNPSECWDRGVGCTEWVGEGYCSDTAYTSFMQSNCPKACGFCGDSPKPPLNPPTPPVNPPTLPTDVCADQNAHCGEWVAQNMCNDPKYLAFMTENCAKSCNLHPCAVPTSRPTPPPPTPPVPPIGQPTPPFLTCEDASTNCDKWAPTLCNDPAYNSFMRENCKKSCGFAPCTSPPTPPKMPTPPPTPAAPWNGVYCPIEEDFKIDGDVVFSGNGWSMRGEGGVHGLTTYNLNGGYVYFEMDASGGQGGINNNLYTVSPEVCCGYCDIQENDSPQCMEMDIIENNGHCCGASTVHTWPNKNGGCDENGCVGSYNLPNGGVFEVKADFSSDGWMAIRIGGGGEVGYYPAPEANTKNYVQMIMETKGAMIQSTQWKGWTPCEGQCGFGDPDDAVYKVKNLRIKGTVVQGKEPTRCTGNEGSYGWASHPVHDALVATNKLSRNSTLQHSFGAL